MSDDILPQLAAHLVTRIDTQHDMISVSLSPASGPGTSSGLKWRNLRRKVGVLKSSSSQTSLISMGNSCGEKERRLVFVSLYNCDFSFSGKKKRSKVYLEVSADNEDLGRIEIELFDVLVPRTA